MSKIISERIKKKAGKIVFTTLQIKRWLYQRFEGYSQKSSSHTVKYSKVHLTVSVK